MDGNQSNNIMYRIAAFIVDKRKAFLVLFIIAAINCILSADKVSVNEDLTDYLPETTETRQGVDIMEREFTTFGTAKIMLTGITYDDALDVAHEMEDIKGVTSVSFYDPDDDDYTEDDRIDYYKDASALYTVTFDGEEDDEISETAMTAIKELVAPYDSYIYSKVGYDESALLQQDIAQIMVYVGIIIFLVLTFTSNTYIEVFIYITTFLMSAILNIGTNWVFGEISFISNAVGTILQLAMGIDYAIILCHRFMEEKVTHDSREAMIISLSKAIPEISSSSLTTVSGLVALMLMQYRIGMDLGRVLTKAIILSLLTVFLFMPSIIMMCSKLIDRTAHKSFVPQIHLWGRIICKVRFIIVPIFAVMLVGGFIVSSKCGYLFDKESVDSHRKTDYVVAKEHITDRFGTSSVMAVVIPKGNHESEGEILDYLDSIERVDYSLGLANVEIDEDNGYVLTDSLTPRQFSEIADIDIDLSRLLYRYYALDKEEYSAFMGSIDDYKIPVMDTVTFLYEEKEKGAIDLDDEKSQDIDDLYDQLQDALDQLEGDQYARLIFALKGDVEGDETFALIDEIRDYVRNYYDEVYITGNSTSDYDLSKSFLTDNIKISVITALFVGIILLFTFQSAGLPVMMVAAIQGSVWINFSLPVILDTDIYFLSYLIVSAIQMGATIDYAIVVTSRYTELRQTMEKKEAVAESLNGAFPTIFTSGFILSSCGFLVGYMTSNPVISSLGETLGSGTLISIITVMTVLPANLVVFDWLIEKTALTIYMTGENTGARNVRQSGSFKLDGNYAKGYINGEFEGRISGVLTGEFDGQIKGKEAHTDEER